MEFKHYATDEIIEVETENQDIVFCKKQNKYYRLIKSKNDRLKLKGTSYILVNS